MRDTVIFDFGGVITASPAASFARLERERGLPTDFIRRVNALAPDDSAWARFERDEIDAARFDAAFADEARALGHELRGEDVLAALAGEVRPRMVHALDWLKRGGFHLGCITNDVPGTPGAAGGPEIAAILARFDHVIESSRVGIRKPDPAIYRMMCDHLGKAADACVYLDDLASNCAAAEALGMQAIRVEGEDEALGALADALGVARGLF